jgi:iron complex transport system ATP-binding protein
MCDPPLIELECVGYRQQGVDILRDLSWRVERGERWAVLGANGSGKTTLLRIACGYLWPTSGVVRRLGEELVDLATLRRSIGWVASELAA